jgi:hypothetical protein
MRKVTPPSNLETVVEELPEARPLNAKSEPIFIVLLVFYRSPFLPFSSLFFIVLLFLPFSSLFFIVPFLLHCTTP